MASVLRSPAFWAKVLVVLLLAAAPFLHNALPSPTGLTVAMVVLIICIALFFDPVLATLIALLAISWIVHVPSSTNPRPQPPKLDLNIQPSTTNIRQHTTTEQYCDAGSETSNNGSASETSITIGGERGPIQLVHIRDVERQLQQTHLPYDSNIGGGGGEVMPYYPPGLCAW
jgi:hypothetical protein